MIIASTSENLDLEKRISITPEIAKKYISLGIDVMLNKNYGKHLGYEDNVYQDLGVKFSQDNNDLLTKTNILVQLGLPSEEVINLMKEEQTLIGVLNPYSNKDKLDILIKKK